MKMKVEIGWKPRDLIIDAKSLQLLLDREYEPEAEITVRELPDEPERKFPVPKIQEWLRGQVLINAMAMEESERFMEHNRIVKFLANEIADRHCGIGRVDRKTGCEVPTQPEQGQAEKSCAESKCDLCLYGKSRPNNPHCRACDYDMDNDRGDNWQPIPAKIEPSRKDGFDGPEFDGFFPDKVDEGITIAVPAKTAALMAEVDDKILCIECVKPICKKVCNNFTIYDPNICLKCGHHKTCHAQGKG